MIKNLLKLLLIILSIFVVAISYLVFNSFNFQRKIQNDTSTSESSIDADDINDLFLIPNITITTIPIESLLAKYYIQNKNFNKAISMLKNGSKVNPYIHYSDYLLATYFLNSKQIDSAYHYSKKALYGWPKNLDHYGLYNKILSIKKDTSEIFEAYKFINTVFNVGEVHHKMFIDSYSDAKLGYIIYEYKDAQSANINQLYGNWQQIYEFEDGNMNKINNIFKLDKDYFYSGTSKYKYKFQKDTLELYFITTNKLISSIPIQYSPSYNTLIFKDIIRDVNSDNPDKQDQFFKKIED